MRAVVGSIILLGLAALPASAQDPDKRVDFHIASGPTVSSGEVNNHLGNGYNINVGATFNINPKIGILAEYSFNGLGQKQVNLPVSAQPLLGASAQPFYADMNMQYGNFDVVYRLTPDRRASAYFQGGPGVYYRPVKVTTPSVGYVAGYCDPFWYYCSPGGFVPVESIVGSRSSTDFGINVGGGVNFRVSESASVFAEIRYHYIWGPTLTDATGVAHSANSAYYPITFGVRF